MILPTGEIMQIHLSKPGGGKEGPYTLEQIKKDLAAHRYRDSDYWAWHEGLTEWVPLYSLPGISATDDSAPAVVAAPEPKELIPPAKPMTAAPDAATTPVSTVPARAEPQPAPPKARAAAAPAAPAAAEPAPEEAAAPAESRAMFPGASAAAAPAASASPRNSRRKSWLWPGIKSPPVWRPPPWSRSLCSRPGTGRRRGSRRRLPGCLRRLLAKT